MVTQRHRLQNKVWCLLGFKRFCINLDKTITTRAPSYSIEMNQTPLHCMFISSVQDVDNDVHLAQEAIVQQPGSSVQLRQEYLIEK